MSTADLFALALAQSLAQSSKYRGHTVHMQRGQGPENKKKFPRGALRTQNCSFSFSGLNHLRYSFIHRNGGSVLAGESIPLHRCVSVTYPAVISVTADHLAAAVSVHKPAIIHLFPIWLLWVMAGTAIRSLRRKTYNWLDSPHLLLLCYHYFQAH